MNSPAVAQHLRENHDEVISRWFENLHSRVADDFEQMLRTPMGTAVAKKMLEYAIEFLETEEYRKADVLHGARKIAGDAAFRRAAVGFSLPDIVATALAFRAALQETVIDHSNHGSIDDERGIVVGIMELNRLGDVLVAGEIAGYFAYRDFSETEDDEQVA